MNDTVIQSYLHDLKSSLHAFDDETVNARLTLVAVLGQDHELVAEFERLVTKARKEIIEYICSKEVSIEDIY